jgi:hypothetical protein
MGLPSKKTVVRSGIPASERVRRSAVTCRSEPLAKLLPAELRRRVLHRQLQLRDGEVVAAVQADERAISDELIDRLSAVGAILETAAAPIPFGIRR